MESKIKKNDFILIVIIFFLALISYGAFLLLGNDKAGKISVQIDGQVVAEYDLGKDQIIEINGGTNQLEIKDNNANMIWADCPDQLCVHQKNISKQGESIICLPNKIVVYVSDGANSDYDAIAQ